MDKVTLGRILDQACDLPRAVRKLGLGTTIDLARSHFAEYGTRILGRPAAEKLIQAVRPRGCAVPIRYRRHTTDINVLQQVFLSEEYACVAAEEPPPGYIVDCGANIGCTAAYFLTRYPAARVVAVEADSGNFEVCRMNLEPFGDRAEPILGAIWPTSQDLTVERSGDGGPLEEWSFHVRPCREGERKTIDDVSLADLAARSPSGQLDLVKMDIEGAEEAVFSADVEPWLSRTRTLVIELHGAACHDAFRRVMDAHPFDVRDMGPVVVARRRLPVGQG